MEVDLSPEEYFRHQAATALLHNDDAIEDPKEAWSDIDDASGTEEDPIVLKKKRILRHGRSRLASMQGRFNTGKSRLYDARQQQLDLELAQLQDGSHPRYQELVEQVDVRWSEQLAKIELRLASSCKFADTKLVSSQTAATNTFVAGRAELRRAMIYRRKKHMWALTDELRNLENVREVIINISCPVISAPPHRPVAAGRYSRHLLDVSGVPPPKAEDDADLKAICSISSLLNHSDTDTSVPEDAAAALSPAVADIAADTRVPASILGHSAKELGDGASMYAYQDEANPRNSAVADRGEYYQYGTNGYYQTQPHAGGHPRHPSHYDAEAGATDYAASHQPGDHRYAASSKISDLLQPSADNYTTYDSRHPGRQPPPSTAYYDGTRPPTTVASTALGKHEIDFEDTPTKRQRMVQSSTTWPASSYAHPQHYAGHASRSWTDLPSAAASSGAPVEGYGHSQADYYHQKYAAPLASTANNHGSNSAYQAQYHQAAPGDHAYYNQQQQHYQQHGYQQQGTSGSSYYGTGTAKYDYSKDPQAAYYQRQPHQSAAAASSHTYYQPAPGHYQQPMAAAGVHTSDSYYTYKQPGNVSAGYPPQQATSGGAGWSDYYQQPQYAQAAQPHRYPQQVSAGSSAQHGPEYYERSGYYNGHQQRAPTNTGNGGDPRHYPTTQPNYTK
ncbi:hypothetical protein IW152_003839 [Coemansia sp. BCRC 34962]|nr:hypothetical protein IW152_003839 [Coemansia sp. BCRC 34962]